MYFRQEVQMVFIFAAPVIIVVKNFEFSLKHTILVITGHSRFPPHPALIIPSVMEHTKTFI